MSAEQSPREISQDWCPRSVVFAKPVRNQMAPLCAEWLGETIGQPCLLAIVQAQCISLFGHIANARQNRCQELPPWRTGGDHQDVLEPPGWRLSSKTWSPKTSSIIVAQNCTPSGDWCLRLALCTPSGACPKRRRDGDVPWPGKEYLGSTAPSQKGQGTTKPIFEAYPIPTSKQLNPES